MNGRPIALAAGGTGGHVFPAEALAAELTRRGRRPVLVTDRRGSGYERRFPGIEVVRVRAATFAGRGALGKLMAAAEIGLGTWEARGVLRALSPAAVVGFGGYPSLPTMLAAGALGLPTVLHEQNAKLGRVNRLLASRAGAIAASFADMQGLREADAAKVTLTGNPVRPAIVDMREHPYGAPGATAAIKILILGGSQGATVLSDVVPQALIDLPVELRARLDIAQQCRAEDMARVRAAYAYARMKVELATFFDDAPARLAACHLAITRAGASTLSELAVIGRPAILAPYKHAADDHQTANAKSVVAAGGAKMLAADDFTPKALTGLLRALLSDGPALEAMARAARGLGRVDAAARLADLVESMANGGALSGAERRAA
jgi:UDP-N-acetylglucosamine--N-acetylmuramyl-(pentapeptide) pyrophosphoryl-undecaprenol N-acetylglucosamine transferase